MTFSTSSPPGDGSDQSGQSSQNPFDPASLRLGQDFTSGFGVKKVLTTVPCRKPNRQEFVRVRSGEEWRLETAILEDKVARENYLVHRSLWSELGEEILPVCLFLAINRQSDLFLWPVKLARPDGRTNPWNESALAAAREAESHWIRVVSNMNAGMYDTLAAVAEFSDPEWPDVTFEGILELCFRGRYIQDASHPVIKSLRGES